MNFPEKLRMVGRAAARGLVRAYQLCISPLLPPCCRFYPTCSAYALEAIDRFGLIKGLYLTGARLIRCHPLCCGGVDLVPETFVWRPWRHQHAESRESSVA